VLRSPYLVEIEGIDLESLPHSPGMTKPIIMFGHHGVDLSDCRWARSPARFARA